MNISKILLIMSLMITVYGRSQTPEVPFVEIQEKQKVSPKNLVVFIHTDWCSYCTMMEELTFRDRKVQELLGSEVYFANLNAETKEDIAFSDHVFEFKPTGYNTGIHELAKALATVDGKVTFPTLTILNPKNEIIFQYAGYLRAEEMVQILKSL